MELKAKITTQYISSRYIDEFIRLLCAPDLMKWKVFPNSKEITESFGAYAAARKYLKDDFPLGDPAVHLVAVGDGTTPRTAVTFAVRTAWQCHSVDPRLRPFNHKVDRLTLYPTNIDQVKIKGKKVIIAAIHSHATLAESVFCTVDANKIAIIAIPCCVKLERSTPPDYEYEDYGIWSEERTVKIWKP